MIVCFDFFNKYGFQNGTKFSALPDLFADTENTFEAFNSKLQFDSIALELRDKNGAQRAPNCVATYGDYLTETKAKTAKVASANTSNPMVQKIRRHVRSRAT
ncbi:hypothetical protein SAMN04488044_2704 [Cognatishimia maritima]|uniref:Uncharacterized protein n=1 Tax=Cognatishimia maritima TaxID=870908 RepID=A0A1M5TUJ3_9RHOB|nr:hypothetical protein SAMN04488044_2704 [Cognatishimia maritima]